MCSATVLELAQESQDLEVQPDQCNDQAEGAVPLHVLRRIIPGPLLDGIEVEQQVERSQAPRALPTVGLSED